MTRRELTQLLKRLTARCWYCGVDMPIRRRSDKHTCGPTCRKALSRQWELKAQERHAAKFPASAILMFSRGADDVTELAAADGGPTRLPRSSAAPPAAHADPQATRAENRRQQLSTTPAADSIE